MQKFNISVPAISYYIAAKCFPCFFKADNDLLNLIEKTPKDFPFSSYAIGQKEGGIIGKFIIDSSKFPDYISIRTKEGELVGEVSFRKIDPIKDPYICFYLPERKKEAGERAFLFSSNEEDLNLLKELAFPFAGD